jgi:hypothetical protein
MTRFAPSLVLCIALAACTLHAVPALAENAPVLGGNGSASAPAVGETFPAIEKIVSSQAATVPDVSTGTTAPVEGQLLINTSNPSQADHGTSTTPNVTPQDVESQFADSQHALASSSVQQPAEAASWPMRNQSATSVQNSTSKMLDVHKQANSSSPRPHKQLDGPRMGRAAPADKPFANTAGAGNEVFAAQGLGDGTFSGANWKSSMDLTDCLVENAASAGSFPRYIGSPEGRFWLEIMPGECPSAAGLRPCAWRSTGYSSAKQPALHERTLSMRVVLPL